MFGITLDRKSPVALSRQICNRIRELILTSALPAGDALPSTRELAGHLAIARSTVTEAYEMLWAEGYVSSRQGARYRVQDGVELHGVGTTGGAPADAKTHSVPQKRIRYDFRTGIPDVEHFPYGAWERMRRNVLDTLKPGDLLYGDVKGYEPLRRAVARWLLRSRGMHVDVDNVFVTSGATQAVGLAVETVRGSGDFVVEDPCHIGVTQFLRLRKIGFRGVPVDEHGIRVDRIGKRSPGGVYVTPSHQFPLGHVMSASRRAQLVTLARTMDFCIIEDDYDSEFRYGGPPLSPLYALDPERVVYVGTFSKTLLPALRVGFAVVPGRWHAAWTDLRRYTDVQNPVLEQVLVQEFLDQRKMDRHVKTMTRLYKRKREMVIDAVETAFGGAAEVLGDGAGLHLAVRIENGKFGKEFRRLCLEKSISVMPCGRYALEPGRHDDILLLGYGNVDAEAIHKGIRELHRLASGGKG